MRPLPRVILPRQFVLLNRLWQAQGPSAGLYYSLGIAEQKDGQRAQAAVNLRRAIMLDPRMVDARMALSEIERSQGVPSTFRQAGVSS